MWRHSVRSKMLQPNRQKSALRNRWNPLLFEWYIQEEASRTSPQGEGKASSTENGFQEFHLTNMWRYPVRSKMLQANRQKSALSNRWNAFLFERLIQEEASRTLSQGEVKASSIENGRQELHLTNMWRHPVQSKMLQPNRQKSVPSNRWNPLHFEWLIQEEVSHTFSQGEGKASSTENGFRETHLTNMWRHPVRSKMLQPNRQKSVPSNRWSLLHFERFIQEEASHTFSQREGKASSTENGFRELHQTSMWRQLVRSKMLQPNRQKSVPSNRWSLLHFERFIQEEASHTFSQGEGKASSTENGFRELHQTNMWRQLVRSKMLQPNRQKSVPSNRWNPLHFEWLIQEEVSHTFSQGEGKASSTENGRQELHLTNMWRHLVRSKMLQSNRQKSAPRNRWNPLFFEWFIQEEASHTFSQGEGKASSTAERSPRTPSNEHVETAKFDPKCFNRIDKSQHEEIDGNHFFLTG